MDMLIQRFSSTIILMLAILASGCTTAVTIHTNPAGALITESNSGKQFGLSPIRVVYEWDEKSEVDGCMRIHGFIAQWASSAVASSPPILTLCEGPKEYSYTVNRPLGVEGLDTDMNFALQVQQTQAMRRQAAHAENQSMLQMFQVMQGMQRKTTKCSSSYGIGGVINTTCY